MYKTILLFLFSSFVTWAAPSTTFKYLMNEQASLLDFGTFKIQKHYETYILGSKYYSKYRLENHNNSVNVLYSWTDNLLMLNITYYVNKDATEKESLQMCSSLIRTVKDNSESYIPVAFFHNGYSSPNNNIENFSKNIMDSVLYKVFIRRHKADGKTFEGIASCAIKANEEKVIFLETIN